MPQTDTETTVVWGIPILFEIKLKAYRRRHMIETCPNLSSLTAESVFCCLKGRGPLKKYKICGNVEEYKGNRLPPMPTLFNSWTIPLKCFS
jgi:hypothetical protein